MSKKSHESSDQRISPQEWRTGVLTDRVVQALADARRNSKLEDEYSRDTVSPNEEIEILADAIKSAKVLAGNASSQEIGNGLDMEAMDRVNDQIDEAYDVSKGFDTIINGGDTPALTAEEIKRIANYKSGGTSMGTSTRVRRPGHVMMDGATNYDIEDGQVVVTSKQGFYGLHDGKSIPFSKSNQPRALAAMEAMHEKSRIEYQKENLDRDQARIDNIRRGEVSDAKELLGRSGVKIPRVK